MLVVILILARGGQMGEWHKSACILCACNCGIEISLDGRRFDRIRGDKAHPNSAGYTCNKALRLDHYQNSGQRLTSPLRRRADGTFEEIGWDTAISEIAAGLARVRDTRGGDKIFYYGGGGQGNHLGGAYSGALLKALGARYRSSALAQEKTGEGWVDAQMFGGHTGGTFEHAEVAVFVGKNPWQSHGFPRARVVLKEIARDPGRALIVIDPVRTETADLADFHLQVCPGTDAWCLAALLGVLVTEDLVDHEFLASHTVDAEAVLAACAKVDIPEYARVCGVEEDLLRAAARRIGTAGSVSIFEDLGVQQAPNSTLCSYLEKLIWVLTGNFAKPGAMGMHSWMAPLLSHRASVGRTPVTGAPILGGLVPGNVIAEEILTEHPDRFRAMIIDSSNPAHSLADSRAFRDALDALELVVVIDVALTETGRHADYVLPAASQYEKWEATFFTLEPVRNTFQLRAPVVDPLPGTLAEPEIYARLVRALEVISDDDLAPLRAAISDGRPAFLAAMFGAMADKRIAALAPFVLYEVLGPTLPSGAAAAAVLWASAHQVAMRNPEAVRRAGHADGEALFDAILAGRSGVIFTAEDAGDSWRYVTHDDKRLRLELPVLLDAFLALTDTAPERTTVEFPFVLAAGERRAFTANTVIRDPAWRRRDTSGALRISPHDAEVLGLVDGARARVITSRGHTEALVEVSDRMQPGHATLPNGLGLDTPDGARTGVAPNELTDLRRRDEFAGTPWHKYVPARIESA
jgi:anaerobic selenocysteine-containing dehydrogenase